MPTPLIHPLREFNEAYGRYGDAIFRYLFFKSGNREVALDLSQETFTKTWLYMAQGKTIDNMQAFLYRVAHNTLVNFIRGKKPTTSLENLMDAGWEPRAAEDSSREAIRSEEAKEVMKKLSLVSDKYKDVLILRYVEEFSVGEIAKILDERENTVSVRIHRGLAQLKKLYEGQSKG